jgi:hypothetical protein
MQLRGRRDRSAVDALSAGRGTRRRGPARSGFRMIGRSEERRRQLPVLERAGWRPAVNVAQNAEQSLEIRVAITSHVDNLIAVLLRSDSAADDSDLTNGQLRHREQHRSGWYVVVRLLVRHFAPEELSMS